MRTYMKQLLLLAMIFATITATGSNQPQQESKQEVTQEYRTAAKALLDVVEFEKTITNRLTESYKKFSREDNPYVDDIVKELVRTMPDKMVDIYSKYLTLEDLKQLTEINKNEIQIKIRNLQPQISKDLELEGLCIAKGEKSPSEGIVVDKDFDAAMKEYLKASGFDQQMKQMELVIENYFGMPSGTLNIMSNAKMPDIMTRIYSKYFTTSEIKQAIALAMTPCYKKFSKHTPAITKDTMEATSQITMDFFQKIIEEESNDTNNSETPSERPKGWFHEKIKSANQ